MEHHGITVIDWVDWECSRLRQQSSLLSAESSIVLSESTEDYQKRQHYIQCIRDISAVPDEDLPSPTWRRDLLHRYQRLLAAVGQPPEVAISPYGAPGLAPAEGPVCYLCHWYFDKFDGYKPSRPDWLYDRSVNLLALPGVEGTPAQRAPADAGSRVPSNTRQNSQVDSLESRHVGKKPKVYIRRRHVRPRPEIQASLEKSQ